MIVVAEQLDDLHTTWSAQVEALYRAHAAAVLGFARARISSTDAEDIVADAFRKAAAVLRRDPEARLGRSWLMAVVRNAIIDRWRYQRRWAVRLASLREPTTGPEFEPAAEDRVWSAMDRLDVRHRAVLMLRYVDCLSMHEVAEAIGTSTEAAESLVRRARRRLVSAYEEIAQ